MAIKEYEKAEPKNLQPPFWQRWYEDPSLIFWEPMRFVGTRLFGKLVGRLVLQSQDKNFSKIRKNFDEELLKRLKEEKIINPQTQAQIPAWKVDQGFIQTDDGKEVETLELFKSQGFVEDTSNKDYYIINFLPNSACYQDARIFADMQEDARMGFHVIAFNYRSVKALKVGEKKEYVASEDELVLDGIAVVNDILERKISDKQIDPTKIILKTHSLGGVIALKVAEQCHAQGQKVSVFADRPLSTGTNYVEGAIRNLDLDEPFQKAHKPTWWRNLAAIITRPIVNFVLKVTGWELNAEKSYMKIPAGYKDYTVVRSSKDARTNNKSNYSIDDNTIVYSASLHRGESLQQQRKWVKKEIAKIEIHTTDGKLKNRLNKLNEIKQQNKDRKLYLNSYSAASNAHEVSLKDLQCRSTVAGGHIDDGHSFFKKFINRVHARNDAIKNQPK